MHPTSGCVPGRLCVSLGQMWVQADVTATVATLYWFQTFRTNFRHRTLLSLVDTANIIVKGTDRMHLSPTDPTIPHTMLDVKCYLDAPSGIVSTESSHSCEVCSLSQTGMVSTSGSPPHAVFPQQNSTTQHNNSSNKIVLRITPGSFSLLVSVVHSRCSYNSPSARPHCGRSCLMANHTRTKPSLTIPAILLSLGTSFW